ncbi:lipoprotein [Sphaerisporangium melleum]|uniref:Lipoprotein n=1 Tax=Sphaerisporangium melleum TaxID=321316 RepID=A0A917QUM8_9ACTN|nr:SurA N-terminal domain-containing protein [Sphaerisporangium melleum]GGK69275.1 lipoprotein [Sphaerisporangium melleum]GII68997.1 lipoprotein [Sphaerisporangium melleum]
MKSNHVRVLLAAVAAGVALTACSSPVQVGTAAVVGDQEISSKRLDGEIREYKAALQKAKINESQLQMPSIPRAVLLQLIYFSQFEQFAQRSGLAISEGDIDRFINEQGGIDKVGPAMLGRGVPPSEVRKWVRTSLTYQKGLERFGANVTDQASVAAAQQKLFAQLDAIPVKLSNRYGAWDTQQGIIDQARFGEPAAGSEQAPPPADPATAGQ